MTRPKKSPSGTAGKVLPCGRMAPASERGGGERKLDRWHDQLRAYLEKAKLKYSDQRWKIARQILNSSGHFSAQEIVREVLKAYPGIGAATVYRNIKVLCDAQILRETLVDEGGRVVYESYDDAHHDHIVCLDCGEIFEFHDAKLEALQQKVAEGLQFTQVRHRHVLFAQCDLKEHKAK